MSRCDTLSEIKPIDSRSQDDEYDTTLFIMHEATFFTTTKPIIAITNNAI